jgi:hypothetical protein
MKTRVAMLCLFTAALYIVAANGQNGTAPQPGFWGRAFQPGPIPNRVIASHTRVSEQSLMIRDPRVLDSAEFDSCAVEEEAPCPEAHGKWSFASVFRRGMAVGSKTTPTAVELQAAIDAWREDMEKGYDTGDHSLTQADISLTQTVKDDFEEAWKDGDAYPASKTPVKLLAIVNRIDTAVPDPAGCAGQKQPHKDMSGAEIRFEFAGVKAPGSTAAFDYLRFIVEFVLPCQSSTDPNDFPKLAGDWYSLADLDIGSSAYRDRLSRVLDHWLSTAASARIRIAGASAGSNWTIREYVFQRDGRLAPENLERDLPGELATCWSATSELGKFATKRYESILASRYQFSGPALSAREQSIEPAERRVLGLAAGTVADTELGDVRHALSINTCRGCHTTETGTNGLHLGQRTQGRKSQISGFLSGASANDRCEAGDSDGDTRSYCAPRIVAPDGCRAEVNANPYQYNDLLRRHLYLDTVVNPSKAASRGSAAWYSAIAGYATLQIH